MSLIVREHDGLFSIFEGTVVELLESNDFEALINAKRLIERNLATLRDEQISRIRQQVIEQATLLGVAPAELFEPTPASATRTMKGDPKYKDPNSDATWTGKGKAPVWMKTYLEAGGAKEDLRIARNHQ